MTLEQCVCRANMVSILTFRQASVWASQVNLAQFSEFSWQLKWKPNIPMLMMGRPARHFMTSEMLSLTLTKYRHHSRLDKYSFIWNEALTTLSSEINGSLALQWTMLAISYKWSMISLFCKFWLIFRPLFCHDTDAGVTDTDRCHEPDEKPTIRNKLGAYFFFDVPRSLTLLNLKFDAIDSLGTWNDNCLGHKENTCGYDPGSD